MFVFVLVSSCVHARVRASVPVRIRVRVCVRVLCVRVHVRVRVCVCMRIRTCMYVRACVACVHACVRACVRACVGAWVCWCVCVCVRVCVCVCTCVSLPLSLSLSASLVLSHTLPPIVLFSLFIPYLITLTCKESSFLAYLSLFVTCRELLSQLSLSLSISLCFLACFLSYPELLHYFSGLSVKILMFQGSNQNPADLLRRPSRCPVRCASRRSEHHFVLGAGVVRGALLRAHYKGRTLQSRLGGTLKGTARGILRGAYRGALRDLLSVYP